MPVSLPPKTALLVIDVQDSFRHRPFFTNADLPMFLSAMQRLIDGAAKAGIPIAQIFHLADSGPFSRDSGFVRTMDGLALTPDAVFYKRRHSALIGSGLDVWLIQQGVERLIISGIRTEQCCETTSRHASDLGYSIDFVCEATLTFPMQDSSGRLWTSGEIKARTNLVLADRFARIVSVDDALAALCPQKAA